MSDEMITKVPLYGSDGSVDYHDPSESGIVDWSNASWESATFKASCAVVYSTRLKVPRPPSHFNPPPRFGLRADSAWLGGDKRVIVNAAYIDLRPMGRPLHHATVARPLEKL